MPKDCIYCLLLIATFLVQMIKTMDSLKHLYDYSRLEVRRKSSVKTFCVAGGRNDTGDFCSHGSCGQSRIDPARKGENALTGGV